MWKYVVTWCIVVMTIEPSVPVPDEFGRTDFGYQTLENRITYKDDCDHERWFTDRKEAFAFYGRAVNDKVHGPSPVGRLTNIMIDSIMVTNDPHDTLLLPPTFQIWDSAVYIPERWELDSIKIEWQLDPY